MATAAAAVGVPASKPFAQRWPRLAFLSFCSVILFLVVDNSFLTKNSFLTILFSGRRP